MFYLSPLVTKSDDDAIILTNPYPLKELPILEFFGCFFDFFLVNLGCLFTATKQR